MESLLTTQNLIAFVTLTALEIVLGIDNIIFLSILTGGLEEKDRPRARVIGLALAMGARVGLLLAISWVMGLTRDLFSVAGMGINGKEVILIGGGLFLVAKSTHEIHKKLEKLDDDGTEKKASGFASTIVQIVVMDLVFSLDSVITAVGMVKDVRIMIVAVIVAIGVMMIFAGRISTFVEQHPTIKVLALSFLILIGVMLVAEGLGQHMSKTTIYFAMAFSLGVELVNMRLRGKKKDKRAPAAVGSPRPSN